MFSCFGEVDGPLNWGHRSNEKGSQIIKSLNFVPGGPLMANLDMEPLNIMGDKYQIERKPSLKPTVVEI